MARHKPNVKKIETVEDANLVLKEIGLLEVELKTIDSEAHKRIADIKESAAKQGEDKRKRIAELSGLLGAFSEYNKDDLFRDRKSVELSFGKFGYRASTAITVRKTTIELLKKLGMGKYLRVKEEADKEAMSVLSDEELAQVDAVRKHKNDFFFETNLDEINKELLKEQM
jgi:phage host-nuclease inhibitor protein Gam